jgi:hypothetical protein
MTAKLRFSPITDYFWLFLNPNKITWVWCRVIRQIEKVVEEEEEEEEGASD